MKYDISIIIVTDNSRKNDFLNCLRSIKDNDFKGNYEVVIISNGDDVSEALKDDITGGMNLKLYRIGNSTRGRTRNEGIKKAGGEILYFIDDDVVLDSRALGTIRDKFTRHKSIAVMGGPNLTPPDSSYFQKGVDCVLTSLWGAWWMNRRYTAMPQDADIDDKSLILCNLCIKKEVLDKENLFFNESLVCNEENLLLSRIKEKGYRMLYTPDLVVYHKRRRNIVEFCYQVFRSGQGRMQITIIDPRSWSAVFFVPAALVLYILSLAFVYHPGYDRLLLFYFLCNSVAALYYAFERGFMHGAPLVFLLFILGHISYGTGILAGAFIRKKKP